MAVGEAWVLRRQPNSNSCLGVGCERFGAGGLPFTACLAVSKGTRRKLTCGGQNYRRYRGADEMSAKQGPLHHSPKTGLDPCFTNSPGLVSYLSRNRRVVYFPRSSGCIFDTMRNRALRRHALHAPKRPDSTLPDGLHRSRPV